MYAPRVDPKRNFRERLEELQIAWYPPCPSEPNGPSPPRRAIGGVGGAAPPGQ